MRLGEPDFGEIEGFGVMLDCDSLTDHGTSKGAGSPEFSFPFIMSQNDDIHGGVEAGEFAACRDRPLVTRNRGTGNDRKKIDVAIRSGIPTGLRSKEPDSLGVDCRSQAISHDTGGFRNVHDRSRRAEFDRMESVTTDSSQDP